jgi:cytochrome c-type protein NapC/trimethylamine-N-oxide reductase cytochrome c-type subunit TorC
MPTRRGAMLAHRAGVYARQGYEKKCVDCHYDLVHSERGLVMFRQTRIVPYQAKGLKGL